MLLLAACATTSTRADDSTSARRPSPTAAIGSASVDAPTVRRPTPGQGGVTPGLGGASWRLMVGVGAVALAGLGVAIFGKNGRWARFDGRDAGAVQVVGRVALTPRHSVHLLRVGERTLVVGTGHGGPPALLGELPVSNVDIGPTPPGGAA